ncbi:MAG: hypothetical protein R2730_10050 [Chitinophagales bacterium]
MISICRSRRELKVNKSLEEVSIALSSPTEKLKTWKDDDLHFHGEMKIHFFSSFGINSHIELMEIDKNSTLVKFSNRINNLSIMSIPILFLLLWGFSIDSYMSANNSINAEVIISFLFPIIGLVVLRWNFIEYEARMMRLYEEQITSITPN